MTTDLPLPRIDSTDVGIQATVENVGDAPQKGVLEGTIENIKFEKQVELAPHSKQQISFDAKNTPVLHIDHPRLWWPNGYGPQNLYKLHLSFKLGKDVSDDQDVTFGVRKNHLLGARLGIPDDLSEWGEGFHSRRRLGTGRSAEAHSARATGGTDSHAPVGEHET